MFLHRLEALPKRRTAPRVRTCSSPQSIRSHTRLVPLRYIETHKYREGTSRGPIRSACRRQTRPNSTAAAGLYSASPAVREKEDKKPQENNERAKGKRAKAATRRHVVLPLARWQRGRSGVPRCWAGQARSANEHTQVTRCYMRRLCIQRKTFLTPAHKTGVPFPRVNIDSSKKALHDRWRYAVQKLPNLRVDGRALAPKQTTQTLTQSHRNTQKQASTFTSKHPTPRIFRVRMGHPSP